MTEPCIIQADYASWRPVPSRKVLQIILEVPLEQTADVLAKLGVPMPGESKWCAIALLENGKPANESCDGLLKNVPKPSDRTGQQEGQTGTEPSPTTAIGAPAGTSATQPKDRRPFASLPLSQQAALRCQDNDFKLFMGASNAEDAAQRVREACDIVSRSDLDKTASMAAREAWFGLLDRFDAWLTDQRYAEARR